jgi:hypothetical protein
MSRALTESQYMRHRRGQRDAGRFAGQAKRLGFALRAMGDYEVSVKVCGHQNCMARAHQLL